MTKPSEAIADITLIVIEDSADDYNLILHRLHKTGLGIAASRVETSSELAAALDAGSCDVVIADHHLPRFTSIEALRQVREYDPDLPFLIVSGTIGEDLAVEAMRAGADDYIMKSKLVRLVPALERALDVAATRRAGRDAAAALTESETRYQALTANLPGLVFQLIAHEGMMQFHYVSEGSRRVLGVAPEEIKSGRVTLFERMEPVYGEALRQMLSKPPAQFPYIHQEGRLRTREDEADRWIEVAARARKAPSGAVLWDGIVSEITTQKKAQEELRELATHITRLREEERESIAREIHDDVGSTLTAVKFDIAWLKDSMKESPTVLARVQQMEALVDSVIQSSTRIMHDLRPAILDEGIVAALEWQARTFEQRLGIHCLFTAFEEDVALSRDQAIAVFRICQEALNNIAKHAGARSVDVQLEVVDHAMTLEIRDDGKGIAPTDTGKRTCFGLRGMRERAHSLGGTLEVLPNIPSGTIIVLKLPVDSDVVRTPAPIQIR